MATKIKGRVLWIGPLRKGTSKSGNLFEKRDVVITVKRFDPDTGAPKFDEDNTPIFTFFGERAKDLEGIQAGDEVTIQYELQGKRVDKDGKTSFFNDLRPFRIERDKPVTMNVVQPEEPTASPETKTPEGKTQIDDLPF